MSTFRSTGHTAFREGDPGIPDIEAEKRGVPPSAPRIEASRRSRKGSGIVGRALRAFSRRGGRYEGGRYELDGALAVGMRKEADLRGLTEREVLEEAVRLYLAWRREGGGR